MIMFYAFFLNDVVTYFENVKTKLNGIRLVIVVTFISCLAVLILEWYVATKKPWLQQMFFPTALHCVATKNFCVATLFLLSFSTIATTINSCVATLFL